MVEELTTSEIEEALRENVVGRIGCHTAGRTYVVPVAYAYDGTYVYGHSAEGLKLRMMRANARVCFEVDHMQDLANWYSVIAWGAFEELQGADAEQATEFLVRRIEPDLHASPDGSVHVNSHVVPAVIYRIKLEERTGRFEGRP